MSTVLSPLSIEILQERIAPLQDELSRHPLYGSIQTLDDLRVFMEAHVFAVWDFMSLLKTLQRALTATEVPWVPAGNPSCRRFINEIVLGEESDVYSGRPLSHFEIYLEAMKGAGASTAGIERTLTAARDLRARPGSSPDAMLGQIPAPAHDFVRTTFRIIAEGSVAAQAAAFTFGREDAIPAMFRSLVRDLNRELGRKSGGDLSQFIWYLERHIEVDGDEHGPISLQMVSDLCGEEPGLWMEAAEAAEEALRARIALWDGVLRQIRSHVADRPAEG